MTGFDLDGFLPYQLAVLSARVSREFSTLYRRKFGISIAEWRVVAHLSQSGSVSVREIHKRVDMDKSKVSRAASRLESNGYVSKSSNPEDGRLVSLALTAKGRAMVAELAPLAHGFEQEVMQKLGQDATAFRQALARLLD
ncbi:MAG: MarR family winged helix-turn-helix transcriptional regulator [Rhodobacter sp.]|nr:MarR family winged helix-turn-helix transcriptional regulator [Rhodobacter sp.]